MTDIIAAGALLHDGRYLVIGRLSEGGMGAIYLAEDRVMHRQVAIKVARLVTPQARDQFRREAAYLKKLQHHGLPRVWDYFGDTQRDFLVMEYIPGEDLQTKVSSKGPQPEWLVLRWADELLDALDFLHTQTPPIIHRDVKPSNLKVRQNGELVLVDFGIAKEYVPGQVTSTGAAAISPGYSPPEQHTSGGRTEARSDIYSAGATLYFLLTGRIPPEAPDRAAEDALLTPKDLVPGLSAETNALVLHALELKRDDRWRSAADMRQEVNAALHRLHGGAPVVTPTQPDPAAGAPSPGPAATDAEQTRLQPPVPAKQPAEDVLVVRPHPVPASTGERLRPTYLSPKPTLPAQPDRPRRRRATVLVSALLALVGLAAVILLLTRLAGGADPQPASPSTPVAALSAAPTDLPATPDVPTATPLAPTPVLTEPAPPTDTPPPTVLDYVIQPGDSLFSIALAFDTDVETLRRLNNLTDDVDTIFVGQALTVPNTGPGPAPGATQPLAGRVVTVQAGDTLTGLAELFGVPWQDIVAANAIPGPTYRIYRGQTLVIPNITTQPPLPTATPTGPLPTSTPTRPTSTPTRPRPTATATPTRPRPKPTATPIALAVTLIRPGPDAVGTGSQTFAWEITAGSLAANRVFELIFWKEGQDPLSDGFGLAAPTTDTQIQVNLDDLDRQEGYPLAPGPYLWGLRLLATPDGRRVGMLGQPRRIFFQETGQTGEQPAQPPPERTPTVSLGLPVPDSTTAANLLANSSVLGLAGVFGLLLLGRWDERRKR